MSDDPQERLDEIVEEELREPPKSVAERVRWLQSQPPPIQEC